MGKVKREGTPKPKKGGKAKRGRTSTSGTIPVKARGIKGEPEFKPPSGGLGGATPHTVLLPDGAFLDLPVGTRIEDFRDPTLFPRGIRPHPTRLGGFRLWIDPLAGLDVDLGPNTHDLPAEFGFGWLWGPLLVEGATEAEVRPLLPDLSVREPDARAARPAPKRRKAADAKAAAPVSRKVTPIIPDLEGPLEDGVVGPSDELRALGIPLPPDQIDDPLLDDLDGEDAAHDPCGDDDGGGEVEGYDD